jgi:hypothetical protein
MAAPTTVFFLVDDWNTGDTGAGTSGQPVCPDFVAPTLASAQWVAQQFSTLFQRSVRLVQKYGGIGAAPYTPAYTPNTTSLALSNAPSGITF